MLVMAGATSAAKRSPLPLGLRIFLAHANIRDLDAAASTVSIPGTKVR